MNLQHRIDLLIRLREYILSDDAAWLETKDRASWENGWFIPAFIELAIKNIANGYLQKKELLQWVGKYQLPAENANPKSVGIIMAGNIPLVGFHDWLCVFISGHKAIIKPSSKDQVLIKHVIEKMAVWDKEINHLTVFADMLKGCAAYIATGSNNSSRYFDYYFGKYPNIIRRNRTSVAILTGHESGAELEALADDVFRYFGLGCRNVTRLCVPKGYDFIPLLGAFNKYSYLADHHKYKNNYDYNLALHLLNKKYYMTNGAILIIEDSAVFSPVSQLNYEFYSDADQLVAELKNNTDLQCIVGSGFIPFGQSQAPCLTDYADGADTLKFLISLGN